MLNSYQFRAPVLGKIRLGVKKVSQHGKEYPANVDYFVLNDLDPDLRELVVSRYGEDPRELDIMFVSDNVEDNAPAWYKWYAGGRKNDKGELVGGRLRCYGGGPHVDGTPGSAVYLEKKDPVTRIAPQRACAGEQCPDFFDMNKKQQCAQTMQVFCMLPLVSFDGVFEIDTRSKLSMRNFLDQLHWAKRIYEGKIAFQPFKIYREEEVISFMDKDGSQKTSIHAIMKLRDNRKNADKLGPQIQRFFMSVQGMQILLPSSQELIERPCGAAFAIDEGEQAIEDKKAVAAKVMTAEDLVDSDAEVIAAFDELGQAVGKVYDRKARLVSVRKKEREPDMKAAVLATIKEAVAGIRADSAANTASAVSSAPQTASAVSEAPAILAGEAATPVATDDPNSIM